MVKSMKTDLIFEIVKTDRENSFNEKKKNIIKRYCIDLIIKFYILLLNSLGKQKNKNTIFVDEIDNSSMSGNLKTTIELADAKKIEYTIFDFYHIKICNHYKIGYFRPLAYLFLFTTELCFKLLMCSFQRKNISDIVQCTLIGYFKKYLSNCTNINKCYLMTDHHFFSSIIAMELCETYVIQHGLVLDKRFYYPIRATYFCAWGKHTKELLNNDSKVLVTGTMKFSVYNAIRSTDKEIRSILYCISSLNDSEVENKIKIIYSIAKEKNIKLLVKCHPGSMFDVNIWKRKFENTDIVFYKEEKLFDIAFDLAISENSTINIDFVSMNKPFVIFDKEKGYFDKYKNLVPICYTKEDLLDTLNNLDMIDFSAIRHIVLYQELNGGLCTIFD